MPVRINTRAMLERHPEGRKRKAIELFQTRYGRLPGNKTPWFDAPDSVKLMACTHLVDKATMIWREKLISFATRAKVLGVFKALKVVRDKCVHPGEHGALIPKENLANLVISALEMRRSLRKAMRTCEH